MDWFIETKAWEWLFSGLGVVVLLWLAKWLWGRRKPTSAQTVKNESIEPTHKGDDIRIRADGDVVVAKNGGKAVQIKDSQVGVVGDHAEIKGGIHFKKQKQPRLVGIWVSGTSINI